jgi:hypothetical protein
MAINVEVYWDITGTQNVTSIDWGVPAPGDVVNKTVYVKNTGNNPMNISMSTSNWAPVGASTDLSLIWDQEGVAVASGGTVQAILSLDVSPGISGISDFSFNIVIEGTG